MWFLQWGWFWLCEIREAASLRKAFAKQNVFISRFMLLDFLTRHWIDTLNDSNTDFCLLSPRRTGHWDLPALTRSSSGTEWRSDSETPGRSGGQTCGRKTVGRKQTCIIITHRFVIFVCGIVISPLICYCRVVVKLATS